MPNDCQAALDTLASADLGIIVVFGLFSFIAGVLYAH